MTVTSKHPALPSIIEQITRKFYPKQIILFGSYAAGNPGKTQISTFW